MERVSYEIMEDLGDTYWWYRARREIIADLIVRHVPNGGRIIDVGAGNGATAAMLRNRGFRVVAADTSPLALDGCCRRGVNVIDLRSNPLPNQAAECVLLGDVLEHVPDDAALLADVRRALVPSGVLLATVPAYEFLWSGEDHVSRHYRRYRLPQLAAALHKGGFDLIWGSYFNTFLLPAVATVLLIKRIFRPRSMYKSDLNRISDGLNETLYRIFRAEARVLRSITLPFGASIIVMATPMKS
jgi:SAM-dependent methyltransferase